MSEGGSFSRVKIMRDSLRDLLGDGWVGAVLGLVAVNTNGREVGCDAGLLDAGLVGLDVRCGDGKGGRHGQPGVAEFFIQRECCGGEGMGSRHALAAGRASNNAS